MKMEVNPVTTGNNKCSMQSGALLRSFNYHYTYTRYIKHVLKPYLTYYVII